MKINLKIVLLLLLTFFSVKLIAQKENNLLPFSNKLLLNPSFAGLNNKTNLWTGIQLFAKSNQVVNNQFSLTYDAYSEKLKGGFAFYFQQGLLGEVNTNTSEFGFSYAGPAIKIGEGKLIPSIGTHFLYATKQWFVFSIDNLLNKKFEPPSPPGEGFGQYNIFKPQFGILYDSPVSQLGISATIHFKNNFADPENQQNNVATGFVFYYAKKTMGLRNELVSQPFQVYPEIIIFYQDDFFMNRASIKVEHIDRTYALFIQNNFTDNYHALGGTFGWRIDNFRINFSSGIGMPVISDEIAFFGEITLGLIIPRINYSEINPWIPQKKLY
ncbi:MAG: hypothetical protein HN778_00295 [Prolixibacteraceae bacterium]|nr:hypothetical protein [Prolixibacteraceae bacterium]MBT6763391.1 hypothetical protein [Prolixibacteraceae bacterium]MBT6999904.1 hypothetical protein [Prolixibacteraceae bacterium]MBT7393250.1 hypothetical protein [Prolixibacteraceae bacterium]